MVRVGGLSYRCELGAKMGWRIQDMRLNGKPVEACRATQTQSAEPGRHAGNPGLA